MTLKPLGMRGAFLTNCSILDLNIYLQFVINLEFRLHY